MTLVVDGSPVAGTGSGLSLALSGLTTSNANDVVIVYALTNSGGTITCTSTHLTFTQRTTVGSSGNNITEFYAVAASALSAEVITVHCSTSAGSISACAFAVSGANTTTPFDTNAAVPASATTAPLNISTTAANTMVIGGFRQSTVASPTAGAGFTLLSGANKLCAQYENFVTALNTFSVGDGSSSDCNGAIVDALQLASPVGGSSNTVLINPIGGQIVGIAYPVTGTWQPNAAGTMQYKDGSGSYANFPGGSTSPAAPVAEAWSFTHPAEGSSAASKTITVKDGSGDTATSNAFAVAASATVVITGVSITANSFTADSAVSTPIGTLSVQTTGGAFTGTLAMGTGHDSAKFKIASGVLELNNASIAAGNYMAEIIPTMTGATNSGNTFLISVISVASSAFNGLHAGDAASITMNNGDVLTIGAGLDIQVNGTDINDGGGSSACAYFNTTDQIWGEDSATSKWYSLPAGDENSGNFTENPTGPGNPPVGLVFFTASAPPAFNGLHAGDAASITMNNGHVLTITSGNAIQINGSDVNDGGGSSACAYFNSTNQIWGEDAVRSLWFSLPAGDETSGNFTENPTGPGNPPAGLVFFGSSPGAITITGVTLSANTFLPNSAVNTVIGALTVQTTPAGSFSGTIAMGSGDNSALFKIASSNLEVNSGTIAAGSYIADIVPTMAGLTNSGQSFQVSLVAQAATAGPGPTVSGSFINANFTSLTGATVAPELFGGSTATMMDFGWVLCEDTSFQAASLSFNPALVRFNCNSGGNATVGTWIAVFGSPPGTPDWTGPNIFIANAHKMFNLATTKIIMGIGGLTDTETMGANPAQFASMAQQIVQHFLNTVGGDGHLVPIYGWEIMNEWDGGQLTDAQYLNYFNAAAVAIHSIAPNAKMYGPVTQNIGSDVSAFLAGTNSTNFNGSIDDHAYSKCPQDPSPTDSQVAQGENGGQGTLPDGWAADRSTIAATQGYSTNYRIFNGEYNIDCADGDSRQQDWRGALFASSWCNKLVDGAANNNIVEGGIWEYGTAGNNYGQFVGSPGSWSLTPSASYLSQATQVCPGSRCTVANPGASGSLCWSTVNGKHFSTTVVNPTSSAMTGTFALSHWPVNGTGTASISLWTQSSTHPNGTTTALAVTAGITASVTIPALGQVILFA